MEHPLLGLQRQVGNRCVQRALRLARQGKDQAEVTPKAEKAIQQARGGGQSLDSSTRTQMEPVLGTDLGNVRVHTGAQADALNRSLNARAFTAGQDVFFRRGAYSPGSSSGRELLAHELTHVAQQTGTKVRPKLVVTSPGDKFEREADRVARAVMRQERQSRSTPTPSSRAGRQTEEKENEPVQAQSIQRQAEEEEEEGPVQAQSIRRQPEEEKEPLQAQPIQRQTEEEETEAVQAQPIQRQVEEEEEKEPLQAQPIQRQTQEEETEPAQAQSIQRREEEEKEPLQAQPIQRQTEEEEDEPVQAQSIQRQAEEEEEEKEPVQAQSIQRQPEEDDEPVQAQPIQRQTEKEEEEPLQTYRQAWPGRTSPSPSHFLVARSEGTGSLRWGGGPGAPIGARVQRQGTAAGRTGTRPAPASGEAAAPGVVELRGQSKFAVPGPVAQYLEGYRRKPGQVRVRYGDLAEGMIAVRKTGDDNYVTGQAGKRQPLPLKAHPLLGQLGLNLIVSVGNDGQLRGFVGTSPKIALNYSMLQRAPEKIGLPGFTLRGSAKIVNELKDGHLALGLNDVPITLGGAFAGKLSITADDKAITNFKGEAAVQAKGLAKGDLSLDYSPEKGVTGKTSVGLNLPKNISGSVDVAWDGTAITGEGKVGYKGEKLSGEVTLRLMDKKQADQLEQQKKAPEQASEARTPAKGRARSRQVNYVVFGEGDLDFAFTDWLTGTAHVIVDPKGHVTVIGKIEPQAEVELFPQKDYIKDLPKLEARASYGIPVVGNIFIFANIGLDAFAKIGPAKLYKIAVEGTYSTDPKKSQSFSIRGSLNVSAAAGMRLRGEAGAGLEILSHDIKAGAGINAIAGIRGYAEATPVIGYREKQAAEAEDKKGEFYISGDLEIAAQPFFGLSGDLFVQVDAPWWSPVPDKKWTWPLGSKEWPIGGSVGMKASVDYVLGSKQWPAVEIKPASFSADKFLTDLYNDKASPKSGKKEQKGSWKEKNTKEAEPPQGAKQGDAKEGQVRELPAAKPTVQPGGPQKTTRPTPPAARTAEGKTVREYQREAAEKGRKPEGKEPPKGTATETPTPKGEQRGRSDTEDRAQKWQRGATVVKQALAYAEREGIDEKELNRILRSIQKQRQFGFKKLYAKDAGAKWQIFGSMSPDDKLTAIKKKGGPDQPDIPRLTKIRQSFPSVKQTPSEQWWVGSYDTLIRFRSKLKEADEKGYLRYLYKDPDVKGTPEAHHIVEKRHVQHLKTIDAGKMPSVLIPKGLHRTYFTGALFESLPPGQGPYDVSELRDVYAQVYQSTPELKAIAMRYLKTIK